MKEKLSAKKYLTAEQKKEVAEYAQNLMEELNETDLSDEEKQECYDTLVSYKTHLVISERLKQKHNAEVDEMSRLNEKYKNEPDDAKAQKYVEQYNKAKARKEKFKEEYKVFETKRANLEPMAREQDAKLTAALERKKEQNIQKTPQRRAA